MMIATLWIAQMEFVRKENALIGYVLVWIADMDSAKMVNVLVIHAMEYIV